MSEDFVQTTCYNRLVMLAGVPTGLLRYWHTLALPGAAGFTVTGALARLPQAMVGLGSVLLLTGLHRTYTLAGLVAGCVAISQGLASPWISRVVDLRGQFRVLFPQIVAHVIGLGLLVLAAKQDSSPWLLLVLGALCGLSMPQFGACSRARWTFLLAGDQRMHMALSIESLIDEGVFVIGPVLVVFLATVVAPAAGLFAAQGFVLVFGLLFLLQRNTEPPVLDVVRTRASSAIRHPGLLVVVGVFLAIGVLFGLIEVGVVALSREQGHPSAAGIVLSLWALASFVSGAVYGAVQWRTSPVRRFQAGALLMGLGCVLVALASGGLGIATVALIVAGLANAPTLITGNILVPEVVPAHTVTEAYTWLVVAIFAGIAVGSAVAGVLIDLFGAGTALWASVLAGIAAAALATTGRRWLGPNAPKTSTSTSA